MKKTIAQLREEQCQKLHGLNVGTDYDTAKRLMNSFYRLCGLAERNLLLNEDERTCNLKSTKCSEEKEDRWYKRLSKEFEDNYGLTLEYCSYLPSIGIKKPGGGFKEVIYRYFYQ